MPEVPNSPLLAAPPSTHGEHGSVLSTREVTARHFGTLLRKNAKLKQREWSSFGCCPWCPFAACCELILPLAVLALLWWAKVKCDEGGQCQLPILAGWGGQMPKDNHTTTCTQDIPLLTDGQKTGYSSCKAWTDRSIFHRPTPMLDVLSYLHFSGKRLAFAVKHPNDRPKVEHLRTWITENWHPDMNLTNIPCVSLEDDITGALERMRSPRRRRGVAPPRGGLNCSRLEDNPGVLPGFTNLTSPTIYTTSELQSYLDSGSYGNKGLLYGAIVFDEIGGDGHLGASGKWSYSIRLNVSAQTSPYTGQPKTRPLDRRIEMREASQYLEKGFVSLQLLLDRYIIGSPSGVGEATVSDLLAANGIKLTKETQEVANQLAESLRYLPQAVDTVPMPVAGIVVDGFYALVSVAFPLVFIIAFLYTQKKVINELITEKETKVRESLRMMGITSTAIIGSWYVTYAIVFAGLCAIFTLVASLQIFPRSSSILIFVLFWLWCMSFLAFALFVHSFFNHSRTGGIVGMMAMFAQWILYSSQNKSGPPSEGVMLSLCLLPNAAFCAGLDIVAKAEAAQVGATWDNLMWPINNCSLGSVFAMMCVDVVLWTLLGWYLDRVLPKEYGVRLPVLFPFMASYWMNRPAAAAAQGQAAVDEEMGGDGQAWSARAVGVDTVEEVPSAVRARSQASGILVRTLGLRKEFSTPGGTKVAVDSLDLAMYEGQIVALLGHNGAGKSTTIHMLTGMVPPSSGDAKIVGNSVLSGMGRIRQIIGVCPQHDVLWAELTVREHLDIFARLRGVPNNELQAQAAEMMQQVGLVEKANTRAGSLSGGQRRKLSLCLALAGRPSVAFLDEPTSGMDPFSRRFTWGIIRGVREGRVTVLTTHFMDEADILGDRIAILAHGVLQCCGSSLFLKNRFGAGYRITCARKIQSEAMNLASGEDAQLDDPVIRIVKKHVPQAQVLTDVGAELSMRLPTGATDAFPDLFRALDEQLSDLGLEHYGLSMVTLEEVFLKVASGEMESLFRRQRSGSQVLASFGPDSEAAAAAPTAEQRLTEVSPAGVAAASHGEPDVEPAAVADASAAAAPPVDSNLAPAVAPAAGASRPPQSSEVRFVLRHVGTLFMKRARYGRRDYKSVGCTVLLPVALLVFGLWTLQKISNRHIPPTGLGLEEQYGRSVVVPFNATAGGSASFLTASAPDGAKPSALVLPLGQETGVFFGRDYVAGHPTYMQCEPGIPPTTIFSKCYRQETVCKPEVWSLVEAMQVGGLNVTCSSNCQDVKHEVDRACTNGAKLCTVSCMRQAAGISRSVCQRQCEMICSQKGTIDGICKKMQKLPIPMVTIGWACPVNCASTNNPDTCRPGTACSAPYDPKPADAAATLSMELLLLKEGQGLSRDQVRYGAVLSTANQSVAAVTLMYNTSSVHAVPTFLNLVTSALKQSVHGASSSIMITNHPMPLAKTETVDRVLSIIVNLLSTFVIIIAFSWIPAAIVAYVVRERESHHNSKHQQLISGVSILAYWTANLMWDMCIYAAPLSLSMFFLWFFDIEVFVKDSALAATFLAFLAYGLAIAPFSYLLSFLFSKHTSAQILCLVINFFTGLLLMITSFILSQIEDTKSVNESLTWIYRLFPGFCLGNALYGICSNFVASQVASQMGPYAPDINFLDWDISGQDIFFLFAASPCYFILTVLVDYLIHSPVAAAGRHFDPRVQAAASRASQEEEEDADVLAEATRVTSGAADGDVIRIVGLRKVYRTPEGNPKVAVCDLSFGLPRGECFGFLGINGAGKTSTLNMLTGAILPSGGTAYLGGHDIVMEQWKVRRLLGYCPQHDALLDRLTVREHLELFGRIKGLPRAQLRTYCDAMMRDLSLTEHVDKLSMTLSGGNKRKLSLAISLMGLPPLVLLDEPSTGVDPAARRLMWDVISAVSTARRECSVMLTTHNMEEAEALCSRIGIMVGGRLRCIGSNQRLKARFGNGYQLEARLRNPDDATASSAARTWKLPERMAWEGVTEVCNRLGAPGRAELVSNGSEEGHVVYEALERDGTIAALPFAAWWLLQEHSEALVGFLRANFPGTIILERHDRTLRFRLPAKSALSDIFRLLQDAKSDLSLEEYGISQTSLEQIFNDFAAQQREETAPLRLLVSDQAATGESVRTVEMTPSLGEA